jgi:hypothetical protein
MDWEKSRSNLELSVYILAEIATEDLQITKLVRQVLCRHAL